MTDEDEGADREGVVKSRDESWQALARSRILAVDRERVGLKARVQVKGRKQHWERQACRSQPCARTALSKLEPRLGA